MARRLHKWAPMQSVKEGILFYLLIAIFIVSLSEVTLTFGANAQAKKQQAKAQLLAKAPKLAKKPKSR